MANKKYVVGNKVYEETGGRKVIVGNKVLEEAVASEALTGTIAMVFGVGSATLTPNPLDNDRISSMHLLKLYQPTTVGE